ncbi:hypothetical protein [Mycobacterium malmoense]|uniref:hypothetical protein n=1 Tax=Mycobacterium malmoense TaxID=1780 RepID=UPI0008F8F13D|nr:hypothetical protein [Mycobacterium malmoense]OIN81647.1 hypothetical protein BMG05_06505 [Mycobacterium malmoense]
MTLINIWTRDLQERVARAVATIEHHQMPLAPMQDLQGTIIRPPQTVDGIHLTLTNLTPNFQTKLIAGLLDGTLTIEDEPAFAFITLHAQWETATIHACAIPLLTYMRHNTLPDWYVPDEKFCQ